MNLIVILGLLALLQDQRKNPAVLRGYKDREDIKKE